MSKADKTFDSVQKAIDGGMANSIQHQDGCGIAEMLPNTPIDECTCDCYERGIFKIGYYMARGVSCYTHNGEPISK